MLRVLAWLFVWFLGVLRFWDLGETILPKFEGVTPSSRLGRISSVRSRWVWPEKIIVQDFVWHHFLCHTNSSWMNL